mmetsp:Transcript_14861/g.45405  ORF Transcript_14861/g.45405 Transcript_14861/m.45405 type:complete len:211 (-) Transcript_14861:1111-1743(-)
MRSRTTGTRRCGVNARRGSSRRAGPHQARLAGRRGAAMRTLARCRRPSSCGTMRATRRPAEGPSAWARAQVRAPPASSGTRPRTSSTRSMSCSPAIRPAPWPRSLTLRACAGARAHYPSIPRALGACSASSAPRRRRSSSLRVTGSWPGCSPLPTRTRRRAQPTARRAPRPARGARAQAPGAPLARDSRPRRRHWRTLSSSRPRRVGGPS